MAKEFVGQRCNRGDEDGARKNRVVRGRSTDLERDCKLESSCHKAGVASRVGDAFRGLTRNAGRQKKGLSSGADC